MLEKKKILESERKEKLDRNGKLTIERISNVLKKKTIKQIIFGKAPLFSPHFLCGQAVSNGCPKPRDGSASNFLCIA